MSQSTQTNTAIPLKLDFNERTDAPVSWLSSLEQSKDFSRYPDRAPLEQSIASFYGLTSEQVFCSNGGDEAINLLMRIIRETSRLILPLPAFSQYTWGISSWNIDTQLIAPRSDLSIDDIAIKSALEQTPNAVLILTRPNNPTGEFISASQLQTYLELAQENNSLIFLDEAYIEFSGDNDKSTIELVNKYDNLVILRTLSKAYGLAGIRLGYLMGQAKWISAFKQRSIPFNIPTPSIAIAQQAFESEAQQDVRNYVKRIIENRKQLCDWLDDNQVPYLDSSANFITLRLPPKQALAVTSFAKRQNISLRSFRETYLSGCLRITIPASLDRLITVLTQALNPSLICCDMDGVLIDTQESYDASIKATVTEITKKTVDDEAIRSLRSQGGFNNDWVLAQALVKQNGSNASLEKVTEIFQSFYKGKDSDGFCLSEKPLISTSLTQRFCKENSFTFSVVTGRPRDEAEQGLTLINMPCVPLISTDDVEQCKPSPEGIKKLQQQYGTTQSWMIGDTPDDIQAALNSNSLAIGINRNNTKALYSAGADIVLDSINELEDWLCQ
ncbi:aminotransferase class I/II-fold pyridoxal phosphate-dependent enzyme [Pleionea sp. CnH1-48]|uniref:aminotransferase class I/II-fold pyridoxal phosphate-dependent enzyme n=1 Tax=Pleionea sp. CnH1-48 TaxID=2954494 RepID=UPI00209848B0|nr:aminotransferase class I/II-fold pyridoxal phosphate-dependent enzyme [Pleionea sp. CnH1-48]MCO7223090.1 aminotransferase class I/II-fold pyridoxal phosphate-dependent enzyme [Pleionea sp. CnH1-48]